MSAAEHLQEQLFDVPEQPVTDVSGWAKNANGWHASQDSRFPAKSHDVAHPDDDYKYYDFQARHPLGFHTGTAWAAREIASYGKTTREWRWMHPLAVTGVDASNPWGGKAVWDDSEANGLVSDSTKAVREGQNVPYANDYEDEGSISRRSPRANVSTWAEHVVRNPQVHTHAERAAVRKGYDLVYYSDEAASPPPKGVAPAGLTATPHDIEKSVRKPSIDGDTRYEASLTPVFVRNRSKSRKSPPQEETLF